MIAFSIAITVIGTLGFMAYSKKVKLAEKALEVEKKKNESMVFEGLLKTLPEDQRAKKLEEEVLPAIKAKELQDHLESMFILFSANSDDAADELDRYMMKIKYIDANKVSTEN